jgi:hypothetical protein
MHRSKAVLVLGWLAAWCVASAATAAPLVVDGSLADWGFTVADNNLSTFVPSNDYTLQGLVTEDTSDTAGDSFFLGPNYGGQNYDVEAMAVATQGGFLHVAIVTGQRPDNGLARYSPGDLKIVTGGGTYGVEVGGGAGGGAGTALSAGAAGSTYTLDANGFTISHATANAQQLVGTVWHEPNWVLDPIAPFEQVQMQMDAGGTLVGQASLVYTRNAVTTQHAIIELAIPLSFFEDPILSIMWRPSCGNDELIVGSLNIVPEPGSFVLAAAAAVGILPLVRRRKAGRSDR